MPGFRAVINVDMSPMSTPAVPRWDVTVDKTWKDCTTESELAILGKELESAQFYLDNAIRLDKIPEG